MKHTKLKTLLVATATIGLVVSASADTLLQPGYAVHTFGVSPDAGNGDGNATLRLYDTTGHNYSDRETHSFPMGTQGDARWNIDHIGNVYGIAIDKERNIYVSASANYSPGYLGVGNSGNSLVPVKYGDIGGGDNNLSAAGTIYKIDAESGEPRDRKSVV